ncbi:MAG: hypothetical protein A2X94_13365 [Bdellovibrionales bacterium GWB1_55_8]|nr:MAG: hypothetical protein A2X94_13365 [Bdellovibrionales bacterium GWB1_55_8]
MSLFALTQPCSANLQVFPTRVVLTDQKKNGSLSMRHIGPKMERYRISAVFYQMKPDGSMSLLKDGRSEPTSLVQHLRFSPREVVLQPGTEQVLRLMLHPRKRLPDGDYRAHIYFEPADSAEQEGTAPSAANGAMQLRAKIAVAIPVILRGNATAKPAIENLQLVRKPKAAPEFTANLVRIGSGFLFGDLHLFFTPAGGAEESVGTILGLSSYIDSRTIRFPVSADADKLRNGKFRVEFRSPTAEGGGVQAHSEISLL